MSADKQPTDDNSFLGELIFKHTNISGLQFSSFSFSKESNWDFLIEIQTVGVTILLHVRTVWC